MSARELLGFASSGAALHVHDLAAPEGDNHRIPFPALSVVTRQVRSSDDLVVTDPREREIVDCPAAASSLQDLTGLLRAASRGRVLPPEAAPRNAAPLSVLREERDERLGVAAIQRLRRSAKLLDHGRSMAQPGEEDESPFVGLLQVEAV